MEGLGVRPVVIVSTDPDVAELEGLVEALGYEVAECVIQRRDRPDANTYLGSGKAEAVGTWLAQRDPPISDGELEKEWLIVANAELRPSQVFNLEDLAGVEVWDRIRLILEIFQAKARVKEARLQVELARLRYELPFVHEAVHRRRTGERPGFMGGGEYEIRTYETHLKRRVKKIQQELERIKKERRSRRAGRRHTGFRLAAIAGYTNAGKTQLLNTLCGDDATVEKRFFSTLQTRTKKLRKKYTGAVGGPLLFTDTVGFIQGLPPWLIDAFSSTLEETVFADVVFLVVDAAEDEDVIVDKLTTALNILDEIGATQRIMILLNKKDKLRREQQQTTTERLRMEPALARHPWALISGKTGGGIEEALRIVWKDVFPTHRVKVELDITSSDHATFESWLWDHTHVVTVSEEGSRKLLEVECSQDLQGNLLQQAAKAGAETHVVTSTGN